MRLVKLLINFIAGAIGIAVLLILAGHFGLVDTVKPYIVQSGSMSPAIPAGSVVLVRDASSYDQNDVITFHQNGDKKTIVTHRIIFKQYPNGAAGEPIYLTNGDANKDIDQYKVKVSDIVGKVYFSIPYIGYGVNVAKTPKGFILFVIIPATIIVYEEFRTIMRELGRLFRKKSTRHPEFSSGSPIPEMLKQVQHDSGGFNDNIGITMAKEAVVVERGMPKAAIVVPVIGAALVLIAFTGAFFLDHEQSSKNIMSASVSFTTPTPILTPTPTLTPTQTATPSATPTP